MLHRPVETAGFDGLIALLPKLTSEQRAERSRLIWESLGDLEERRGRGIFDGAYTWSHYGERKTPPFPAAFVRRLNKAAWLPDTNGELAPPSLVVFDTLGWEPNPFLLTKIAFKPQIIDQLAKEAGIDPEVLDLLRRNPSIVAELVSRLGSTIPPAEDELAPDVEPAVDAPSDGNVYDDANDLYGDDMPDIPPGTPDPDGGDGTGGGQGNDGAHSGSGGRGTPGGKGSGNAGGQGKRSLGQTGARPFISYVGTHPDEDDSDPDGLDQKARMEIEEQAIALITAAESTLRRTPEGNPGFDLYETDRSGKQIRWVEVKSMTDSLENRPVGLSRTQFDWAREKGDAYWLYVVEHATDSAKARILRIQNPVGHARTFTFDRGWSEIAQTEPPR